jgi:hypothetical protein
MRRQPCHWRPDLGIWCEGWPFQDVRLIDHPEPCVIGLTAGNLHRGIARAGGGGDRDIAIPDRRADHPREAGRAGQQFRVRPAYGFRADGHGHRLLDRSVEKPGRPGDPTLGDLGQRSFLAPSALARWSRATIAAHLTWVAGRYVVMTADVARGARHGLPGPERAASLTGFDTSTPQDARERFLAPGAALACVWGHPDSRQWSTTCR